MFVRARPSGRNADRARNVLRGRLARTVLLELARAAFKVFGAFGTVWTLALEGNDTVP
jgi:hypothetical protein